MKEGWTEIVKGVKSVVNMLLVMFFADREVVSFTANIMQLVSIYVLMEGFSVCTLLLLLV